MNRLLSKDAANATILDFSRKIHGALVRHTYLLLFIALFIVAYPILEPGIIIGGDFPVLDTGDYAYDKLWIWLEKGGVAIYEGISRFPVTSIWYILSFVNIDASIASKIMILTGFSLASFSFYFSFLIFFRGKLITGIFNENNFTLKLGAIIGALFFAYNIWSFFRIGHWHFWIGYSVIPLFFVSTYLSFKNLKDWKYILCSLFLWSFASMTPHMALFYGIMFTTIFLFFVFRNLVTKKRKRIQIQILVPFALVLLLYPLVNFYWIYPYVLGLNTISVSPDYVVSTEVTELLSRDSSFLNTFRMVADWTLELNTYEFAPGSFLDLSWPIVTFAIPIFAFSSLILSRKLLKYTLVFSGAALAGIFIAMGTNSPFDYYKLLLGIPVLSNYIWLFRDPDKWSFLIAFAYSFLIGIGTYTVLQYIKATGKINYWKKAILGGLFMVLIFGSICVYSFPAFDLIIQNRYKPISFPSEFDNLNEYLSKIRTEKVYFMPYPLAETTTYWKNDSEVGRVYQMHSIKPSIESTEPASRNYYKYLINSIDENRFNHIDNLFYPLGTSYLIFHNDTWNSNQNYYDLEDIERLNRIRSLGIIKNMHNIGFYNIFKVGNETGKQINLFKQNNVAVGGLEILATLDALGHFSAINSSVVFADNVAFPTDAREYMENSDVIVAQKNSLDDLIFSYIEDKYILSPFDATLNYNPSKTWSRAGATDPPHGEFHPELARLGISNWEFDFGKGLVMTSSGGANVSVPVEVSADGKYNLVIRYLKNIKGGLSNVYLDNTLVDAIDTLSIKNSNDFVWKTISDNPLELEKGRHTLTLENVIGLNAVNVIGIIPNDSMDKLIQKAQQLITTKKIIYLLEGESSFYNKRGKSTDAVHYILNNNVKNSNSNASVSGQFEVPANSDLISFEPLTKISSDAKTSKEINNFTIFPAEDKINLLNLDFETKQQTDIPDKMSLLNLDFETKQQTDIPLALLVNHNEDALAPSRESVNPISGNSSLRVDVQPVNRTGWSILSTDLIPINDKLYYEYSMNVRGTDVDNFHVRIAYFGDNKTRIGQEEGVYTSNFDDFADKLGKVRIGQEERVYTSNFDDFADKISSSIIPPKGSEFLRIEILVGGTDNKRQGSYIADDMILSEVIPYRPFKIDLRNFENKSIEPANTMDVNSTDYSKLLTRTRDYEKARSDSIFVNEGHLYNYTANIGIDKTEPIVGLVSFRSSDDTIENSTKYGVGASRGSVLSLAAGSEIYSEVEVLMSSNYTLALRVRTCEVCTSLTLSIDRIAEDGSIIDPAIKTMNISLKDYDNGSSKLEWIYLNNTYFPTGNYGIRIHSNSETDLDLLAIYADDSLSKVGNVQGPNKPLNDTSPAYLMNYKKINPTKYTLEIRNATRPYTLSLAESYDPLWVAYANDIQPSANGSGDNSHEYKTNSIPLYSIINGFHINRTGTYYLTLEYEPQMWFFIGGTISAIVVILLITLIFVHHLTRKNRKTSWRVM